VVDGNHCVADYVQRSRSVGIDDYYYYSGCPIRCWQDSLAAVVLDPVLPWEVVNRLVAARYTKTQNQAVTWAKRQLQHSLVDHHQS
jgi:hypothetical protein